MPDDDASPARTAAELKRRQIVEAARVVLARDGLGGCTARAVADASPLTKSAIHYYFADIDEIVDRAVAAHLAAMLVSLRDVAGRVDDPEQRLRAVLLAYLGVFTEKPQAAFLWFEYWVAVGRRGDTAAVETMLASVETLVGELLEALPGSPSRDARAIVSWLLGTVVQQQVRPLSGSDLGEEVDRLLARL